MLPSEVGGGAIFERERERWRASSWCDCLVCESDRWGIAGVVFWDEVELREGVALWLVFERFIDPKYAGCCIGSGDVGDAPNMVSGEVAGVDPRLELFMSESSPPDQNEAFDEDADLEEGFLACEGRSGAV